MRSSPRPSPAPWAWAALALASGAASVILRVLVPGTGAGWDPALLEVEASDDARFVPAANLALPLVMAVAAALSVVGFLREGVDVRRRLRWDRILARAAGRAASTVTDAVFADLAPGAAATASPPLNARTDGGAAAGEAAGVREGGPSGPAAAPSRRLEAAGLEVIGAAEAGREFLFSTPGSARGGAYGGVSAWVSALDAEALALKDLAREAQRTAAAPGCARGAGQSEEAWDLVRAGLEHDLAREQRLSFSDPVLRNVDPAMSPAAARERLRQDCIEAQAAPTPEQRAALRQAALDRANAARERLRDIARIAGEGRAPQPTLDASRQAEGALMEALAHDRWHTKVSDSERLQREEPEGPEPLDENLPEFHTAFAFLAAFLLLCIGMVVGFAVEPWLFSFATTWLGEPRGPWAGALLGLILATTAMAAAWLVASLAQGGRLSERKARAQRRARLAAASRRIGRLGLAGEELDLAALDRPGVPGRERARAFVDLEYGRLLREIGALQSLPGRDLLGEDVEAEMRVIETRLARVEKLAAALSA